MCASIRNNYCFAGRGIYIFGLLSHFEQFCTNSTGIMVFSETSCSVIPDASNLKTTSCIGSDTSITWPSGSRKRMVRCPHGHQSQVILIATDDYGTSQVRDKNRRDRRKSSMRLCHGIVRDIRIQFAMWRVIAENLITFRYIWFHKHLFPLCL